jgi:hypothetical protein
MLILNEGEERLLDSSLSLLALVFTSQDFAGKYSCSWPLKHGLMSPEPQFEGVNKRR